MEDSYRNRNEYRRQKLFVHLLLLVFSLITYLFKRKWFIKRSTQLHKMDKNSVSTIFPSYLF